MVVANNFLFWCKDQNTISLLSTCSDESTGAAGCSKQTGIGASDTCDAFGASMCVQDMVYCGESLVPCK